MSSVSALLVIFTGEDCFNLVFLKVQILLKIVLSNIFQFQTALEKFEFNLSFAAGAHILFLHFYSINLHYKKDIKDTVGFRGDNLFPELLKKAGLELTPYRQVYTN